MREKVMETRVCARENCGTEFQADRYSLKKYCSQNCRQILWVTRKMAEEAKREFNE